MGKSQGLQVLATVRLRLARRSSVRSVDRSTDPVDAGVCEQITPFAQALALQSSSRSGSPALIWCSESQHSNVYYVPEECLLQTPEMDQRSVLFVQGLQCVSFVRGVWHQSAHRRGWAERSTDRSTSRARETCAQARVPRRAIFFSLFTKQAATSRNISTQPMQAHIVACA